MNMQAAGLAARELGAEIRVVKRSSPEYAAEKDPPRCPSVMVNCRFIVRDGIAGSEQLAAALAHGPAGGR